MAENRGRTVKLQDPSRKRNEIPGKRITSDAPIEDRYFTPALCQQ